MCVPSQLQQHIDTATQALLADAEHQLRPIYRCRIYQTMHDLHGNRAYLVRGRLALLVVQRVLPLWDQLRWYVPVPHQLLAAAQGVLDGTVSVAEADALLQARAYDDDYSYGDPVPAGNVLFVMPAAARALAETLSKPWALDPVVVSENDTDVDIDFSNQDTAGLTVLVLAGKTWEKDNNPTERRAFWRWWLDEAIPAVYSDYG
jgi:hypothetical protein